MLNVCVCVCIYFFSCVKMAGMEKEDTLFIWENINMRRFECLSVLSFLILS